MKEKSPSLKYREGDGISLTLFFVFNRKQVKSHVELKSTKTKFRRDFTCHLLILLESLLIFKTQILFLMKSFSTWGLLKGKNASISAEN